ncbi:S-adenosyl-L-methionine-dependent methyltransferase [Neurospora crassa]|nr:S-adenosyl-L-methionine-dependent methyltransferase [Neurospora crassa]
MATEPAQQQALLSNEEQAAIGILPPSHWEEQSTVEDPNDDSASTIGSFISSTASLSSTIFEYRTIHGRTYHGEMGSAESWEPNDERHSEALDLADFADEFPNAEVIGTDITPIQPSWVPANVKFELDDCNLEWTWPDNTFDFIHMRMLFGIIEDWDAIFRQAYRTCKPGGYTESFVCDSTFRSEDDTVKDDSALAQWGKVWNAAGRKMGRTFEVFAHNLQQKGMEAAGFVDIEVKDYYVPLGVWHKDKVLAEKGLWWKIHCESDLEGYLNYPFNVVMGWTPAQTGVYAAQLRKELGDPKYHAYTTVRCVWGRKPE